jgi:putative methyltransferase (TIGR04325 family)
VSATAWLDRVRDFPVIRTVRKSRYDRLFENNADRNLFRGTFNTPADAQASAPATRPVGYDNAASADLYLQRLRIDQHDYPSLYWLSRSFVEDLNRVADIGGSVGIKYFAFQEFVEFPADLVWRVIDVPAVARRGREFAASRGPSPGLEFSDTLADADGMDVIFASGVLQYLPQSLPELLSTLVRKPRRILINTTPIHPERSFFTLNSIGTAYCPYRVQAREPLIDAIESQGYRLRDEWQNLGKEMQIPFEAACSLRHYTGFCFDAL